MDDLVAVLGERRHRRFLRIRRARKVDYKPLLQPPTDVGARCPHTTQLLSASHCSICLGAKVKRVAQNPIQKIDEE